jgi:hypothetical protein
MEWANLVRPVADDYIEYLVAVAKDDNCSISCMSRSCYRLTGDNFTQCLYSCGCNEKARYREFLQSSQNSRNKVLAYGRQVQEDFETKNQEFRQKELQFTYKYYDFLERQAVNAAGCDAVCVNNCTDPTVYPLN